MIERPDREIGKHRLETTELRELLLRREAVTLVMKTLHELKFDFEGAPIAGVSATLSDIAREPARHAFYLADKPALLSTSLGLLVRLFVFNMSTDCETCEELLPGDFLLALRELGILERNDSRFGGRVSILPYKGKVYFGDQLFRCLGAGSIEKQVDPCCVMPPGRSSFDLLAHSPSECPTLLDIGTGCGFLALQIRSCYRIGFDRNPRAIAFSQFNALVNELDAMFIEEDARTARSNEIFFDLILFNAPTGHEFGPLRSEPGLMKYLDAVGIALRYSHGYLSNSGVLLARIDVPIPRGTEIAKVLEPLKGDPTLTVNYQRIVQSESALTSAEIWEGDDRRFVHENGYEGMAYLRNLRDRRIEEIATYILRIGRKS
jgi:Methyltransferase small domain